MTRITRSMALVVEGVGSDTASVNGIAWYKGHSSIASAQGYEWIGGSGSGEGIVDMPASVGSHVDPFEVQISGAGYSVRIAATNKAKALWLHRPFYVRDVLNAKLLSTATTVVFAQGTNYTWSASDDSTVVWIGDEAILLGVFQAGGTFTGCTRGMWSTTPMHQPARMNVWSHNPFRINRRAEVYTYDHDTDVMEQAWQGFISGVKIDGPAIRVSAVQVLPLAKEAMINRGKVHQVLMHHSSNPNQPNAAAVGVRGVNWSRERERYAGKRVNKTDAESPHWVAVQTRGAGIYAEFNAGTGFAPLTDVDGTTASGSKPFMGSAWDTDALGADKFELLVVDRLRDQSAALTNPAYADFRSSSRDLDKPFHPVALAMAILTSSYSTAPGFQGFGNVWTLDDRTQYYTNAGTNQVDQIWAIPDSDDALVGVGAAPPVADREHKRVPAGGTVKVWGAARAAGWFMNANQRFSFATWGTGPGRYAAHDDFGASDFIVVFDLDGTGKWSSAVTGSHVVAADSSGLIYARSGSGASNLRTLDGTAASAPTPTVFTPTSDTGTCVSMAFDRNESALYGLHGGASTPELSIRLISGKPGSGSWSADTLVDLTAGSYAWTGIGGQGYIVPARDQDGAVWVGQQAAVDVANGLIYKIDSSGGLLGTIDISSDTAMTVTSIAGIWGDSAGFLYALVTGAGSLSHVYKYNPGGTFVTSTEAQDITTIQTGAADLGLALVVTDTSGSIMVSNNDGEVVTITQA